MNYPNCARITALHKAFETDLSSDEIQSLAALPQPSEISQCSFYELLQASENLDRLSRQIDDVAYQKRQQILQEIQTRKARFEKLQSRLNTNLQKIRFLNSQLHDRVFAKIDFELLLERVLDGDETALQQELSSYRQVIHEFYEELTLRKLAPIACQKRRLIQKAKRLELFYEYLPVFSLAITTVFLHCWLTWTWSLIGAMFIVGPMMIWFAYPKRCALRSWAKHTLETQQSTIAQGQHDLSAQEAHVLNLLFLTLEGQA